MKYLSIYLHHISSRPAEKQIFLGQMKSFNRFFRVTTFINVSELSLLSLTIPLNRISQAMYIKQPHERGKRMREDFCSLFKNWIYQNLIKFFSSFIHSDATINFLYSLISPFVTKENFFI